MSVVSGGLSGELKKKDSSTRNMLDIMVEEVIQEDPEFILKVSVVFGSIINIHGLDDKIYSSLLLNIYSINR